jgi:Zn-dependent protease with chaperone function
VADPAIRALFYDGRTSRPRQATALVTAPAGAAVLQVGGEGIDLTVPLAEIRIGERVGTTNRLLGLPDGASLEILDNEPFDAALATAGLRTVEGRVRRLEGRWRYAALAGVATVLISVWFLRYGLPALAARALRFIPQSVDTLVAQDTLHVLDETTLTPSRLTAARQEQLRAEFAAVVSDSAAGGIPGELVFRTGNALGANALALPSGVVVLTDELVSLAQDDDELRGVFAHEVGHLVHRHAMRMLVQSSASALLLAGVFGDVGTASSLTAAAPAVLVSAAYSRDFERQADTFAFQWMAAHQISPRHLGDLLGRIAAKQGHQSSGYLGSHPDLAERTRAAAQPR